jgi:hypothetical protein
MALLAAPVLRAEIILELAPREPTAKRIDVPKPKDTPGATGEKAAPVTDLLHFANNDTLHGWFLAYEKAQGVRWQSLESKEPIAFQTANLSTIKLDSHKPPANATAPTFAVMLTNDDELPGNLISLDDKVLLFETWYAGQLSIPRAMVKRITPLKTSVNTLFEGPTGMEGWVLGQRGSGQKGWIYRDGALVGTNYGTIGRDVKLPGVASVDFDIVLRGNPQVSVCLYSDRADNLSNCYMFQINSGYISLQRYTRDGGSNSIGEPVQLRNMMRREKMHLGVRTNKEARTIALLVEGKMVKQWIDTADFAGTGGTLIFSTQQGSYVKVSGIKVATWDGRLDEPQGAGAKSKEDSVKLENRDRVSGKLKSIEEGKALFASSYADLTIPLARVEEISMSSEGAEPPKRNGSEVRAFFSNRGSVTMDIESWDGKQAVASSPNFGKAVFSPDAFQRLQFNLNQPPPADEDSIELSSDENQ